MAVILLASLCLGQASLAGASHSSGQVVDDDCSLPGTPYFYRGGPASDWYQNGSTPYCNWSTNSATSRSNYANIYIDPNSNHSGYYGMDTYIVPGYTGRARYNRYQNGTSGGVTTSYTKLQSGYSNQYVRIVSKVYFCENVNTPCAGYMQFADNGGTPYGTLVIDVSKYFPVH